MSGLDRQECLPHRGAPVFVILHRSYYNPPTHSMPKLFRKPSLLALAFLAAITLIVFAPVLIQGRRVVIGERNHDVWMYFYWMREWGFRQLVHGNMPLWNPNVFCGMPFFGTTLSAMLYPPNALFLILPTSTAMNWSFALHVFLAGAFTFAWCRVRGISHIGATLAAVIYMFCGAHFFKVGTGWPNLTCAIAWVPLVLASVDLLFKTGKLRWSMLGALAASMQILCGGSQYAYMTAVVVATYVLLNLIFDRQHWRNVLIGTALIYLLAGGLCAWQITAAADLTRESVRAGGMPMDEATAGSFHPSAFMTLLSPFIFGLRQTHVAIGSIRWLMLNVSIAGLVLAAYGAFRGQREHRRFSSLIFIAICIIALGMYNPLYRALYEYLPAFKYFRATSRISTLASLFLAMLAAAGFERLRHPDSRPARLAIISAITGIIVLTLGIALYATRNSATGGAWGAMLKCFDITGQMYQRGMEVTRNETHVDRATFAATMLLASAGLFLLAAALLAGARRIPLLAHGIAGLALIELLITAWCSMSTIAVPFRSSREWVQAIKSTRAGERTWQTDRRYANWAMGFNKLEANGYDPAMFGRFRTFLARIEDDVKPYPGIARMLRISKILVAGDPAVLDAPRPPSPHVVLVHKYRVASDQDGIFTAMKSPDFDPAELVILESQPAILPQPSASSGSARIVLNKTDELEITADTPAPAILLVTDAYSRGWRATPFADSSQRQYEVMPADWLLRAIPLSAGKHHILLRYRPQYYAPGKWISILTLCGCLAALLFTLSPALRPEGRVRGSPPNCCGTPP